MYSNVPLEHYKDTMKKCMYSHFRTYVFASKIIKEQEGCISETSFHDLLNKSVMPPGLSIELLI